MNAVQVFILRYIYRVASTPGKPGKVLEKIFHLEKSWIVLDFVFKTPKYLEKSWKNFVPSPGRAPQGTVLEFFFDFSEKLSLKNAIKSENLGVWGGKFFPKSDFGKYCRKVFRKAFFRQNYVLKLQ